MMFGDRRMRIPASGWGTRQLRVSTRQTTLEESINRYNEMASINRWEQEYADAAENGLFDDDDPADLDEYTSLCNALTRYPGRTAAPGGQPQGTFEENMQQAREVYLALRGLKGGDYDGLERLAGALNAHGWALAAGAGSAAEAAEARALLADIAGYSMVRMHSDAASAAGALMGRQENRGADALTTWRDVWGIAEDRVRDVDAAAKRLEEVERPPGQAGFIRGDSGMRQLQNVEDATSPARDDQPPAEVFPVGLEGAALRSAPPPAAPVRPRGTRSRLRW